MRATASGIRAITNGYYVTHDRKSLINYLGSHFITYFPTLSGEFPSCC